MPALREVLAKFGFDIDSGKLAQAVQATDQFAGKVKDLTEKFLGGSLGGVIKDWIGDVKDATSEFKGLAKLTGTNAQDMQRWTTAAKLSGSSVEALAAGLRVLQKNQAAAASGQSEGFAEGENGALEAVLSGKKAQETFKALGVEVKDSAGKMKTATQLLGDVGLEIAKIKNPSERAAVAARLLGRQGAMLLPLFAQGEEGLQGFLDKIDELGGGVSEKAMKALAAQSKASKEYDLALLSLKSAIVGEIVPAMTQKVRSLSQVVGWLIKASQNTNTVKAVTLVLGATYAWLGRTALISAAKTALVWAPTAIAVALLVLLVDDLITTIQGGDSVISKSGRAWLEWLDGSKVSAETSQSTWDQFVKNIQATPWSEIFADSWNYWTHGLVESLDAADIAIKTWLFQMKDIVEQLGPDIMTALADALINGWAGVGRAIDSLGEKFTAKIREAFNWHSPPQLALQLGADWDMALAKGIVDNIPTVQGAAQETFSPFSDSRFAPSARVPSVTPTGGFGGAKSVQMNNEVRVILESNTPAAYRDATRDGIGLGFSDERRAILEVLEAQG